MHYAKVNKLKSTGHGRETVRKKEKRWKKTRKATDEGGKTKKEEGERARTRLRKNKEKQKEGGEQSCQISR